MIVDPKEFVKQIRASLVEESLPLYIDILENTKVEKASDKYWIEVLLLYKNLNSHDKATVAKIIRYFSVDTVAAMFGVLDGVSWAD